MRLILLFTIIVGSISVKAQSNYAVSEISDEFLENANAVVRLNETNVVIESKSEMLVSKHRVVTVLNEKGNQFVGAVIGYDNYIKVKELEAYVYDSNGNKIKRFKKKDFIDHSAVDGGTLYSDSRVLYMPFTPTSYPYTVDFSYVKSTQNTAGIPTWDPVDGYSESVEKSVYTLIDKSNLGLNKKEYNLEAFSIISDNSENKLNYELSNFKAFSYESRSPLIEKITPRVSVTVNKFHFYGADGQASNWQEFGDWIYYKLLQGRDQVSLKTKNDILKLVEGINDPIKRATLVYKYVQENTRYISVQVGIGGVQPIPAIEVDKVKYGDCKGLTNYTLALMKIANVKAYYSVVEAGNDKVDFEDDFYSLEQGNHIILAIENDDDLVWVDCTSQVHPFGFVGDFTDDRKVLLVREGKSRVVKTVAYKNDENLQETEARVELQETGDFTSSVKIETRGIQYDQRFVLENLSNTELDLYYKRYWDKVNFLKLKQRSFNNDKENVVFTESLEVEARKYAMSIEDKLIFMPNFFNNRMDVPKRYSNRKLPLSIKRGFKDVDSVLIDIPSTYKIDFLPAGNTIISNYGEYKTSFSIQDEGILYTRSLAIREGEYTKEDYGKYRSFIKKIVKADKSKIILIKK